jgi:hypothetical protein
MTQSELISSIVNVVIRDMIEGWRKSRGVIVTELDMEDLPMPGNGLNGEQLARYFDLQAKSLKQRRGKHE